jgi:hypothetical protein
MTGVTADMFGVVSMSAQRCYQDQRCADVVNSDDSVVTYLLVSDTSRPRQANLS